MKLKACAVLQFRQVFVGSCLQLVAHAPDILITSKTAECDIWARDVLDGRIKVFQSPYPISDLIRALLICNRTEDATWAYARCAFDEPHSVEGLVVRKYREQAHAHNHYATVRPNGQCYPRSCDSIIAKERGAEYVPRQLRNATRDCLDPSSPWRGRVNANVQCNASPAVVTAPRPAKTAWGVNAVATARQGCKAEGVSSPVRL